MCTLFHDLVIYKGLFLIHFEYLIIFHLKRTWKRRNLKKKNCHRTGKGYFTNERQKYSAHISTWIHKHEKQYKKNMNDGKSYLIYIY